MATAETAALNGRTQNPSSNRRVLAASSVGTVLEWYDFFLYGTAAALVFDKLFFSTFAPVTGTLASFATFGVGLLRPAVRRRACSGTSATGSAAATCSSCR